MDSTTALPQRTVATSLRYLLKAMRPKQWVKNAFVFAGIVFAEQHLFTQSWAVVKVLAAFILFCLVSSAVYLINDLTDIEQDRQHPKKRLRPLAAGHLSPILARVTAVVLAAGCLVLPFLMALDAPITRSSLLPDGSRPVLDLGSLPLDRGWFGLGVVLVVYFLLQLAYTYKLKHVVIVDLFAIAAGFVLRAIGGAAVLSVAITPWWLMCVLFLALFLGLGKRRNELQVLTSGAGSHRRILEEYSPQLLEQLIIIDVTCTLIAYSFATYSAPSVPQKPYPFLMLTIPFVIYAMFRYLYLIVQKGEGGEPADLLFRDRPLLVSIISWGLLVVAILVLFGNK